MVARVGRVLFALALVMWPAVASWAQEQAFDFADPKGVNGITFILDSDLEPIVGIAGGVAGEVTFDPQNPEQFAGSISVAADQITFVNQRMTGVLQGKDWLNIAENLKITVTFGEVIAVGDDDDKLFDDDEFFEDEDEEGEDGDEEDEDGDDDDDDDETEGVRLVVAGTISVAGKTIEQEFEIYASYIPGGGAARGEGGGDLLVLRSEFEVSRYDLGIKPDMGTDNVGDEVWVIVPIAGYSK